MLAPFHHLSFPSTCTHTHTNTQASARTHKQFQGSSPLQWRWENALPNLSLADHLPKEASAEGPRLRLLWAGQGRVVVPRGGVGSDGRGGKPVPGVRQEEAGPASLARGLRDSPSPKPEVLQGEFVSSLSTRFIICLLWPGHVEIMENAPPRRQHQALRVEAGRDAQ